MRVPRARYPVEGQYVRPSDPKTHKYCNRAPPHWNEKRGAQTAVRTDPTKGTASVEPVSVADRAITAWSEALEPLVKDEDGPRVEGPPREGAIERRPESSREGTQDTLKCTSPRAIEPMPRGVKGELPGEANVKSRRPVEARENSNVADHALLILCQKLINKVPSHRKITTYLIKSFIVPSHSRRTNPQTQM